VVMTQSAIFEQSRLCTITDGRTAIYLRQSLEKLV
jgi:hypothetical protein